VKKIAIIGASYLQLPLVLKAKEMGLETHCFAWAEGAVCKEYCDFFYPISILEKEQIYNKCKEIGIDGITTIATDMAVPAICYTAEKLDLISNSYESSLISTNKGLMRKRFLEKGVKSPVYVAVNSYVDTMFRDMAFPLIVKPVDRSGSKGVTKVNTVSQLEEAIKRACEESFTKQCVVEEYIVGAEVSVESISWRGEHSIITITDKTTTGDPYFVELAHHQPSQLSDDIQQKIKSETLKALNALEINYGAGHSEFKITDKGEVYAIEVGARMGGDFIGSHLVELSTGCDFLKAVLEIALGDYSGLPKTKTIAASGVYFLCKETQHLRPYFDVENDFEVEKQLQNDELKEITNSNDRSGYIIYQSTDRILI